MNVKIYKHFCFYSAINCLCNFSISRYAQKHINKNHLFFMTLQVLVILIRNAGIIRSGEVIYDNVNIGTNAVATHDIPSNCVVGEH